MKSKLVYVILFFFLSCNLLQAQKENSKNDSTKIYQKIEKYSKKNKFNKFVYRLLFKSQKKIASPNKNIRKRFLIQKAFERSEGKIIRNINIETLDPFGYSIDNSKDVPEKGYEKLGNKIHLKTKNWTIRNLLLIKKNEPLDSLVAKESERLIRKQRFVRSVIIKPVEIPNSKDSIDISVRVLDSWSLIPNGSISGNQTGLKIKERNFLGLGHEIQSDLNSSSEVGNDTYRAQYYVSNFKNTLINGTLIYDNLINNQTLRSARIERTFLSPFTRNAGGAYFEKRFYLDSLPDNNMIFENQNFKLETQEYWYGHSFNFFNEKIENFRATNLITTVGYKSVSYLETPTDIYDPSNFYSSEKLYLASIGINTRKYAEDKYLFNFGIIEDVAFGQVYSITAGFQEKNNMKRTYIGARIANGHYYSFGYLEANLEGGSFFNNGTNEETTLRLDCHYFTNLFSFGKLKLRQFINPSLAIGKNRAPIISDRVTLYDENGISGFDNPLNYGTKKLIVSFQTQTYVSGNWKGFHFSPFYNMTFGLLGDETNKVFNDKIQSKFSLGILINNDYIVFEQFQISLSFYPSIPNEGTNIFRTNSFNNDDLSLPNFEIGQPAIVIYK